MNEANAESFNFDDIIEEIDASSPKKPKIEGKEFIGKMVQSFPCLWNKADKFYRNQTKRNAAWNKIAEDASQSVEEVKKLWKKAKDARRYNVRRKLTQGKSGDAALSEDDEAEEFDELRFLEENSAANLRETMSLGLHSKNSRPSTSQSDYSDSTSNPIYGYAVKKNKKDDDKTDVLVEAFNNVGQSLSGLVASHAAKEQHAQNELKYKHTWLQLESMFEDLEKETVTDLCFSFISETYKAILEKRANNTVAM